MPDLYKFTFDDDRILPILTRGSSNTIDPFSYTGDGGTSIYSKINTGSTDPIDVVNDFPWTKSPKTSRTDIPTVYLKEKRLLNNSTLANFFYSILASEDVVTGSLDRAESGTFQFGNNEVNLFETLSAAGATYTGTRNAIIGAVETIEEVVDPFYTQANNFVNKNAYRDNIIKPYNGLYPSEETGFNYFLPYFSDGYLETENTFSEDSQKLMGLDTISQTIAKGFDALRGFAFLDKPGVYVEQSKQYQFGQEGRTFDITFPLLNTGTYEDVKKNWQLLFGLIYQNKPGRINRNILELPVIYEFFIEGMAYMPYSFISQIQVDFIGNRRTMNIDIPRFNDVSGNDSLMNRLNINTVIPDAYNVKITLKGLNKETKNFMIRGLGDPIIKTRIRETSTNELIPESGGIS